jgi:hypothetical protein
MNCPPRRSCYVFNPFPPMKNLSRFASPAIFAVLSLAALGHLAGAQTLQTMRAAQAPAAPRREADFGCNEPSATPSAAVFLSGALTAANDKSTSTATSGALGISRFAATWAFSSQVNVAAKTDTVKSGFGASLLTPGSGSALTAGLFDWRRPIGRFFRCDTSRHFIRQLFGEDRLKARAYGTVSSSVWSLPAAGTEPAEAVSVVPVGFGLGLTYTLVDETINAKPVGAGLVFGYSRRLIHGDIAGESHSLQRTAILGTSKESFSGYEAGLELQFGQISGGVTFYSFPRAATVPGFSRGQVVAGFSIRSNVLETDPKKDTTTTTPPKPPGSL